MSSRLAADRRIRAAALQAAPGLDVRGPVSQALGRAGIAVPPAPLAEAEGEAAVPEPAPTATDRRPRAAPAARVVKRFEPAAWPTRKPAPEPEVALSGLTADERRVHRILLDTLAVQNDQGYGQGVVGLSYAEKQRLAVLDLAFIDAEIAKMDRGFVMPPATTKLVLGIGGGLIALVACVLLLLGESGAALFMTGVTGATLLLALAMVSLIGTLGPSRSSTPRRKIYDALRELALLADPAAVTSDALRQADAVIDRLADADDAPRLRLDDAPTPAASGAVGRTRARS